MSGRTIAFEHSCGHVVWRHFVVDSRQRGPRPELTRYIANHVCPGCLLQETIRGGRGSENERTLYSYHREESKDA